eukprot:scaffold119941_cov75-Phaeocystis_antarctica.AAC.1
MRGVAQALSGPGSKLWHGKATACRRTVHSRRRSSGPCAAPRSPPPPSQHAWCIGSPASAAASLLCATRRCGAARQLGAASA